MTGDWIDRLGTLVKAATQGPWEFQAGNDSRGDSVDLLVAEIGISAGDEDPEYAEVLFGQEIRAAELSANWSLICELRNEADRLLSVARASKGISLSGVEHDDPRLRYITVQIDRGDWDVLRDALKGSPQSTV